MYKIVGADRREYGPVTREAVLEWIAQGRANAQTIARFEEGAWKPLSTFDEFKDALAASAPVGAIPPPAGTPPVASSATTSPPPAGAYVVTRETNQMAVWALVLSILGLFCCPCLPLVGLILGIISLGQINENPHKYSTDASLAKIAIGIAVVALLIHCGWGFFFNGFNQLGRQFKFR